MIPHRIKVKNFGPFSEAEVDLTEIFLASIVGKNGRGKSTLFTTAPTFALYGVTKRGRTKNGLTIDKMLKTGTTDLLVQFEFEHQDELYQITRTYTSRGKGKSTLDFQKWAGNRWESLNGTTIAETQAKIVALLRLDADTFVSSSMILQGKADEFASKAAVDRKAILSEILGLSVYDDLQKAASGKASETEKKLAASQSKLSGLKTKLETLPEIQNQFDEAKKDVALNAVCVQEKEDALADVQSQIKTLGHRQIQAQQFAKDMETISQALEQIQTEADELDSKIATADLIMESEPEITAKIAELTELRTRLPALEEKVKRLGELAAEESRLREEESRLANEQSKLAARMVDLELELSAKDELQQDSKRYQQMLIELKTLDEKAEKHQHFSGRMAIAENDLLTASANLDSLLNQFAQLEKKVFILSDSGCIDSQNAKCKFLADAQEAKTQMPALQKQIEQSREALCPLNDFKMHLKKELEAIAYDSAYHAQRKAAAESLRKSAEKYAALAGKEELLQEVKTQREALDKRIGDLNDKVLKLQSDIQTLKKEVATLPALKAQIAELEPYEKEAQELPQAKANREAARLRLVKLMEEKAAKSDQFQTFKSLYDEASNGLSDAMKQAREKNDIAQLGLKTLQAQANALFTRQGSLQAQLDALHQAETEHKELNQEIAPLAKELVRWQTLSRAFSKNGIPVLILENALPELERITNDILGQMSAGEHTLQFITQRDAKSKDSQIETLDILVSDWEGTRPYETFSGGEQLRIDLAIRLGLSELLANRAGSKIEWIAMDEVWGSQDAEHRELLVTAIKSIAPRFKKVLSISHIAEVQDAFDQKIVLNEGGKVEVVYN